MEIPITFEHSGKTYKGHFSRVAGAGSSSMFFLNVNGFHAGQLFLTDSGWRFYSNSKPELNSMSDYFGEYVMLWIS